MTTIAYRNGIIAADTLVTSNGTVCGTETKIGKVKNILFGACGSCSASQKFRDWVRSGLSKDIPSFTEAETFSGIIIDGEYIITLNKDGSLDKIKSDYIAIGSGNELATGAMAHGATAIEAVKAAIKHDTSSGGEVLYLKAN